jgi:hypothetical protein
MTIHLTIARQTTGESPRSTRIALEEWLACISTSKDIRLLPSRIGINPFTRQPCEIRPPAGSAYLNTESGDVAIEFSSGELGLVIEDKRALPRVEQIAQSLNAVVRVEEF